MHPFSNTILRVLLSPQIYLPLLLLPYIAMPLEYHILHIQLYYIFLPGNIFPSDFLFPQPYHSISLLLEYHQDLDEFLPLESQFFLFHPSALALLKLSTQHHSLALPNILQTKLSLLLQYTNYLLSHRSDSPEYIL